MDNSTPSTMMSPPKKRSRDLGNEEKISVISKELRKFLVSKNYVVDDVVNPNLKQRVEEILLCLILNCEYQHTISLEAYTHLNNVVPQLSLCLLTNIVVELNFGEIFAILFEKLPLGYIIDLLDEMLPCLKKSHPKIQLEYTSHIVRAVTKRISNVPSSHEIQEKVEKMVDVIAELLRNLTGLQSDQFKHWKSTQVYQHMGYTLLSLIELLLDCDCDGSLMPQLVKHVVATSCSIIQNVTINVFCTWAEVDHDDGQSLQTLISWKAYQVIEKYKNDKSAKELSQMLTTFAKKPKSLPELVREADTETILKMINKVTPEQKVWFKALLGTSILKNDVALKCIDIWAHLSDSEDAMLLLQISIPSNHPVARKLAIKCASNLSLSDFIPVLTRTLYRNGFEYILNDNVQQQLLFIFNKIKDKSNIENALVHDLLLLVLQNPSTTLGSMFQECLKNKFYTSCLKSTFEAMKDLASISHYGSSVFNKVFEESTVTDQNLVCYVALLDTLIEVQFFSSNLVANDIVLKSLKLMYENKHYVDCKLLLQIYSRLDISFVIDITTQDLYLFLFRLLGECRCKFMNFNAAKKDIVNEIVLIFKKATKVVFNEGELMENPFQSYYAHYLLNGIEKSLLLHLSPNFNCENYAEAVSRLIQILPSCILDEWLTISSELITNIGRNKTIDLLTDVLILLCQVVKTQETKTDIEDTSPLHLALGFCLFCYGTVIKDKMQSVVYGIQDNILEAAQQETLSENLNITRNVCRLVRELPNSKKQSEGLSLINLLNEDSLKHLACDKVFVTLVASINEVTICKILAQKMMQQK